MVLGVQWVQHITRLTDGNFGSYNKFSSCAVSTDLVKLVHFLPAVFTFINFWTACDTEYLFLGL
jgi:hypothetical protein